VLIGAIKLFKVLETMATVPHYEDALQLTDNKFLMENTYCTVQYL
jgi:hypothetical protein